MASISKQKKGLKTIQFFGLDQKRHSLRLGKTSLRNAESFKTKIEAILEAKMAGRSPEAEVSKWLASLPSKMHGRLARVGLAVPRVEANLAPFIKKYVDGRSDVKPATKTVWSQGERGLIDYFGANHPLREVTPGDADDYKQYLLATGLAPFTVLKRLQFANTIFRSAKRRRLIEKNPFTGVSVEATMDPRDRFITAAETNSLLEAAPDQDWRTIIALARYGGLRCPSEVLSLRWGDINWDDARILVTAPKTERYPGKAIRTIPLFHNLKPFLLEARKQAPEGAVYVVDERYRKSAMGPSGWKNSNLRTRFTKIIKSAGLTPWPKPFRNLRSSCETELQKDHPIAVVAAWMGHSVKVALRHYIQVTDEDFRKAIDGPSGALRNPVQQPHESHRNVPQERGEAVRNYPEERADSKSCQNLRDTKADGEGFEVEAAGVMRGQ